MSLTGTNSNNENKGSWSGSNREGRGRNSKNRPTCQVCGKIGHATSICYYGFNQSYMGAPPNQAKVNLSNTNNPPYNAFVASPETISDQIGT